VILNRDRQAMFLAGLPVRSPTCIAPVIDPTQWGKCSGRSTLDHVKSQLAMGVRAPSDEAHLVALCEYHHLWTGWATGHRPELRVYLAYAVTGGGEDD
jgi:hypothetical protein